MKQTLTAHGVPLYLGCRKGSRRKECTEAEPMTNTTEKVVRDFGFSGRDVLLVLGLILVFSTKSYVVQEMLFWFVVIAILFALVILIIGLGMAVRQIGRSAYRWMKIRVARISAYRRDRPTTHDAMSRLPYR